MFCVFFVADVVGFVSCEARLAVPSVTCAVETGNVDATFSVPIASAKGLDFSENNFYSPNFQFQTTSLLHNLNSLIKARVSHIIKVNYSRGGDDDLER